jgi:hypothetical protein
MQIKKYRDNIESINIFKFITETLGPKRHAPEQDLWDVTLSIAEETLPRINDNITEIENELQAIIDEYITHCLEQQVPREAYQQRCTQLSRMVASQLHASLEVMYRHSVARFDELVQFLTLGLGITGAESREMELLYSRTVYVDRHKAMLRYNRVPHGLTTCYHPSYLRVHSRLSRDIDKVRIMVRTLSKQLHSSTIG